MTVTTLQRHSRRLGPAFSRDGRPAASALFRRSSQLLNAAQELEREAGKRRVAEERGAGLALGETVECMAPTLQAVANASLLLSLLARDLVSSGSEGSAHVGAGGDADHATRLLFGASQNIRIAAEASKLAAEAVRTGPPPTT